MTRLVRWEPFLRDFGSLASRFNQLLEPSWETGEQEVFGTWVPPVDIVDKGEELILAAELPGMRKEDIHIGVENNILTLSGERRVDEEFAKNEHYRSERHYGKFQRSFTLPATVDVAKIDATYRDGILSVRLPKAEEARPRQIHVKVD